MQTVVCICIHVILWERFLRESMHDPEIIKNHSERPSLAISQYHDRTNFSANTNKLNTKFGGR